MIWSGGGRAGSEAWRISQIVQWAVGMACMAGSWWLLLPAAAQPIIAAVAALTILVITQLKISGRGKAEMAIRIAALIPWLLSGPVLIAGPWLGKAHGITGPEKALVVVGFALWLNLTAIQWFRFVNWRNDRRAKDLDGGEQ